MNNNARFDSMIYRYDSSLSNGSFDILSMKSFLLINAHIALTTNMTKKIIKEATASQLTFSTD